MGSAIRVEQISKCYRVAGSSEPRAAYQTLREELAGLATATGRWLRRRARPPRREFWALRDVEFEVRPGEVVGVIGRNGAGKSTLLKIISRITPPTSGRVRLRGRVGTMLEVGTGFHPELTGRENVYLSGAVLGMSRREVRQRFDEIVAFAGVETFLELPVKRYSSGMYVRLAFAVAAHLRPEILLVDEVLAVGDAAFQKRCLGKIGNLASEGRTVLLVSHGMDAIRSLCPRAIWLEGGRIQADGSSRDVVSQYLDACLRPTGEPRVGTGRTQDQPLILDRVTLTDAEGKPRNRFSFGGIVRVEIAFTAPRRIERPYFWIGIGEETSLFGAISLLDGAVPDAIEDSGVIACTFRGVRLLPRYYNVYLGVRDENGTAHILPSARVGHFEVVADPREIGMKNEIADAFIRTCAPVCFPYEWELPDGKRVRVADVIGDRCPNSTDGVVETA